jgi:hypothetical protein
MDVSRLTIESPGQVLTLARTGSAWRLESPFIARADDVVIRRLVTSLAAIQVERFMDDPLVDSSAPQEARVTVTCETNVRRIGVDDEVAETKRIMTLGLEGAADVAARNFFATDGHGRRFVVSGSALTDMSLAPETYVALTPTSYTPADIGMVQIEEPSGAVRAYRRGLGEWTQQMPDGSPRAVADAALEGALQLICSTPAASVATTPPEGLASLGALTLLDFDNGPLIELGASSSRDGKLVIAVTPAGLRTPGYYLIYDASPPEMLLPGADLPLPTR